VPNVSVVLSSPWARAWRTAELLEKALGKRAIIDRQPLQAGDVPITFANIDKARRKLGYNPRVRIEEGIPKFVEWFRSLKI